MIANADGHRCYHVYCTQCHTIHHKDEQCWVQPIVVKQTKKPYLLVCVKEGKITKIFKVFYDFECSLLSPSVHSDEWIILEREDRIMKRHEIPEQDEDFRFHHVNW